MKRTKKSVKRQTSSGVTVAAGAEAANDAADILDKNLAPSSSSGRNKSAEMVTPAGTLNQDVFKSFEKNGRSEFLKYLKQQLSDNDNPVYDKNNEFKIGISGALYDLLWHGLRGAIRKETVLQTLLDVGALHTEFACVILDVVNILDNETSLMTDGVQEERTMFVQLVKDLDKVLPERLIKERLEIDTLQEVGIVKNKSFYTKFIKVKTKLYYKQRRFNLFREESEGFSKLITELNQDFEEHITHETVMDTIKSLIGCFNLDPNRVLDIILESFEMRPERWQLFIPLLRSYMSTGTIICEILGYKFCHFKDTRTPRSLFNLCALLLKHDVIKLNEIYSWLSPTDAIIKAAWEQDLADAKEFVSRLNIVSTNKDKEPQETDSENDNNDEKYTSNQKFGLCEALLKVGDWENAKKIIDKLPEQSVVVHEPIARALGDLIHLSIEKIYYTKCFNVPSTRIPFKSKLLDDPKTMQKLEVREFSDLRKHVLPMAVTLGPSTHYDMVLMFKLVRTMRTIITEMGVDSLNMPPAHSESEKLYYEVISCLDACIFPSLSYLDSNSAMAEEIWTVLKNFPYHYRYAIYARWKNEMHLLNPKLIRRAGAAQKRVKALMKRVTKENVKQIGRSIGKYSHCAPGILFDYILLQIQLYDNLIGPVVDAFKYLTTLSFDCLGYCLIEALALRDRDRFKHEGTSISLWLQSLASFCGSLFKKYNVELSGVLQYVANQLKAQKSLDLLLLREIVQKMAGVESVEDMTNDQIQALCGGELLRGEAGYFSQVRNTKKSSLRLKEALANNDLAVTLCLLMAQQKHCVIYRETAKSHLKMVGMLYDQCQDTLVQFGTFLGSTYSVDEYVERLPSIIAMLQEYHIHLDVAFFLARPMFTHQINQKYDQLRRADPNAKKLTSAQKMQKYLEATHLVMNPIVESVRPLHSTKIWEDISPQFLVTFWSLSMYDLQVPTESYQREINKLKQLSNQAADSKDSNASKNKKEQERYIALMEKLNDERKKQQEHVDKVLQRLQEQKDTWFLSRSVKSAKNDTITQFLQLCLFPRCTFTALDALYCANFVHTIHNLKTINFSTLLCYDRIFCDITYSLTACTENEANRYGRFLCAMLETVMRWHADQAVFNKECASYPGFVTKFRVSNQFSEANDHVGYENYRHVCHKWHYKITKAIVFCLDSKDYMQIRNSLIILKRILPHFPMLTKLAQIIERKVEKVRDEEKNQRPDLFALALSYSGQLKLKTPQMCKESDFHIVERSNNAIPIINNQAKVIVIKGEPIKLESGSTGGSTVGSVGASTRPAQKTVIKIEGNICNGVFVKTEKPSKDVETKPKIIKLNPNSITITSNTSSSNNNNNSAAHSAEHRERERERDLVTSTTATTTTTNISSRSNTMPIIEIKDEHLHNERDTERHGSVRSIRSTDNNIKKEKDRDTDRTRERSSHSRIDEQYERSTSKREKRRDERHRNQSPGYESMERTIKQEHRHMDNNEYDARGRERDLSSVSNDSNGSLQHRRSHDNIEYEKDSKRRKMESQASISTASSKKQVEELVDSVKKARGLKRDKERKDKLTDEEKDARKERKLGRKRDRNEESSSGEHKRRRDAQNGEDELRSGGGGGGGERMEKYHTREKSPHLRERSHEKFERERGAGSSRNDDRQYSSSSSSKSARSRNIY